MNIFADNFKCYIEGIRIPLYRFNFSTNRNELSRANISIPIGNVFDPKHFSSAFIQITKIENNKEKLFYEGICEEAELFEEKSLIKLDIISKFASFNLNSTLDYVSPRKYGLTSLDKGMVIHVGTDLDVVTDGSEFIDNSLLSNRYFFNIDQNITLIDPTDPEANKLFYIINRFPFAERFALSFFEQIAYNNFSLSKSYIDRFNLLAKISGGKRSTKSDQQTKQAVENTFGLEVFLDPTRSGIAYEQYKKDALDVSAAGCSAIDDPTIKGTISQSSNMVNFRDVLTKDNRSQYVEFRDGSPRFEQFCTPETAEALLKAAERIYAKYSVKLIVGDISKTNSNGTDFIRAHWDKHKEHTVGTAADLYIPGATNSQASDYNFDRAIGCLKIFFELGCSKIGFQDFKRQADLSKLSGGAVMNYKGHTNHFHVQF